ncbi:MAG: ATP-binding protein [Candidatus Humimicrobiaceae bacterium]
MTDKEDNISFPSKHSDIFYSLPIFVRIAVYDNLTSIPRIIDLKHDSVNDFIDITTEKIYQISHDQGGKIPYTIIREIVENLIHAEFSEVIITIINNGNQIMITDQGPGISDIDRAMLPGFTSATKEMKKFIRGVGSGLPIVKETIRFSGGTIDIKNNMNKGTVVILKINSNESAIDDFNAVSIADSDVNKELIEKEPLINLEKTVSAIQDSAPHIELQKPLLKPVNTEELSGNLIPEEYNSLKLSLRQIKILYLTLELEESGPSLISKELGFSLSTSFRELSYLEKEGLLKTFSSGKKRLSKKGFKYLEYYSNTF